MHTRITVNGKDYASVEEMPADARRQYERAMSMLADRDGNGVPDLLEGGASVLSQSFADDGRAFVSTEVTRSKIVVNGQEYARLEEVPPEVREMIRAATGSVEVRSASRRDFAPGVGSAPVTRTVRRFGQPRDDDRGGGITIRLTWSTLVLFLIAAIVVLGAAWLAYR